MKVFLLLLCLFVAVRAPAQLRQELHRVWQFRQQGTDAWLPATVPGTVHTDLLQLKRIPDPFFGTNETALQWIDTATWEYRVRFTATAAMRQQEQVDLVFDGLDTDAFIYLNGALLLRVNNMFRQWRIPVKALLRESNELVVHFNSARRVADSLARSSTYAIPDHPRVHVRKAQYHFGWDWGPTFITCGIWKPAYLEGYRYRLTDTPFANPRRVELVRETDSTGQSFYFRIDGQPVYMKGANYIPSDVFLPRLTSRDYHRIIRLAKEANMNMLRVWGGGVYEADIFYELCDRYRINVWQDFMFAGGMIPVDDSFFRNVKAELEYQVKRLRKYKCIVLWCGNNEVEEAWNNWGWQGPFNLHGADSAAVWNAYQRLFHDSLPVWLQQWDGTRPYLPSSPVHGWGRPQSITEGDSHYWGLWWGLQDLEVFEHKTGRFVSEYGMQAMPTWETVKDFTAPADRYLFSDALRLHQKHPTGYQNLQHYLHRYFLDSGRVQQLTAEDYTYLTQCLQYFILKNSIAIHRSKFPVNQGTLLWQLNDCWPVVSWSITDYYRRPKAAWYAVKEAYRDDVLPQRDSLPPRSWKLEKPEFRFSSQGENRIVITSTTDAAYVYVYKEGEHVPLNDNYFHL
ncbi:MAG TPA: hypothetical protein PKE63_01330, partial [Lacibacter sp.]|nr:hypothetical protein [Lacibacter sp.]